MPHGGPPGGPGHFREMPTHTGVAYHAPGPDGQPWLHLRGTAGEPAPNWNPPNEGMGHDGSLSAQGTGIQSGPGSDQVLPETAPVHGNAPWTESSHQFMPFNNHQVPHPHAMM